MRSLSALGTAALVASIMAGAPFARAADPASVQAPVKGSDVMGDKGRTGPDGWVWAPQTRDQVPADSASRTAANGRNDLNSQPGPEASKKLAPGDDPGTPAATDPHGPGTMDSAGPHKP